MPFAITEIDPNIPAHEHTTRKKSSNNCDRTGERTTADTLQKGKNEGFDKNMNSERTIKAQHQKEETNPEQDLEGAQQTSEISKIFEFSNDFERVRELYLSLCSERYWRIYLGKWRLLKILQPSRLRKKQLPKFLPANASYSCASRRPQWTGWPCIS